MSGKDKTLPDAVRVKDSIISKSRTYYCLLHLRAAVQFERCAADVENTATPELADELSERLLACTVGTVLTAVAFLEATINELFSEASDDFLLVGRLDAEAITMMGDMWETRPFERSFGVLDKFQTALTLAKKQRFDPGKPPYQDVDLLIELRNHLVHYKHEWTTISSPGPNPKKGQNLENKLRGKFPLNPLMPEGYLFLPYRCLGHGCAEWAVRSSLAFTDDFFFENAASGPIL